MKLYKLALVLVVCLSLLCTVPSEATKYKKKMKKGMGMALIAGGAGYALGSYKRKHRSHHKKVHHIHHHHDSFHDWWGLLDGRFGEYRSENEDFSCKKSTMHSEFEWENAIFISSAHNVQGSLKFPINFYNVNRISSSFFESAHESLNERMQKCRITLEFRWRRVWPILPLEFFPMHSEKPDEERVRLRVLKRSNLPQRRIPSILVDLLHFFLRKMRLARKMNQELSERRKREALNKLEETGARRKHSREKDCRMSHRKVRDSRRIIPVSAIVCFERLPYRISIYLDSMNSESFVGDAKSTDLTKCIPWTGCQNFIPLESSREKKFPVVWSRSDSTQGLLPETLCGQSENNDRIVQPPSES